MNNNIQKDTNMDNLDEVFTKNRVEQLRNLINSTYNNLEKISNIVAKIEQDQKKEFYKNVPGMLGTFDGVYLVSEDGKKEEVPANYAAKSRLVFGDTLKIVKEEGKDVFKQLQKVERKKVEGILAKKEGSWYLLTDIGSYQISDTAATFNNAQVNDKALGIIPLDNDKVPYAALDKLIDKKEEIIDAPKEVKRVDRSKKVTQKATEIKPIAKAEAPKAAPVETEKPKVVHVEKPVEVEVKKPVEKIEKAEETKEFVANIVADDDDLV